MGVSIISGVHAPPVVDNGRHYLQHSAAALINLLEDAQVTSMQAAHSSLHPPEHQPCAHVSLDHETAAAGLCPYHQGARHGPPAASSTHQDKAVLHNLQQLIEHLHPHTQALFRDSLFRISRNAHAEMMGRGNVGYAAHVDRAVADLLFNNIALAEHPVMHRGIPRSHVRVLNRHA